MTYTISTAWTIILIIGVLWELFWKGIALWRAAQQEEPVWFGALLLLNTAGILPIIYLLTRHEYRPDTAATAGHTT